MFAIILIVFIFEQELQKWQGHVNEIFSFYNTFSNKLVSYNNKIFEMDSSGELSVIILSA